MALHLARQVWRSLHLVMPHRDGTQQASKPLWQAFSSHKGQVATSSRGRTSKGQVSEVLLTLAQRLSLQLQLALQQPPPQAARQVFVATKVGQQDPHEQRVKEDPLAVRSLVEVVLARGRLWGRAVLVLARGSACRGTLNRQARNHGFP